MWPGGSSRRSPVTTFTRYISVLQSLSGGGGKVGAHGEEEVGEPGKQGEYVRETHEPKMFTYIIRSGFAKLD
jgi:hypothetical protein